MRATSRNVFLQKVHSALRGFDMPAVVDKRPLQVEHVKTGAYS